MNKQSHQICEQYLNILYRDTAVSFTQANIAETRGEILYGSINKLIPHMQLSEKDVFADLGSGKGKITSQIFLITPVKSAVGIEIVPELHQTAMSVAERIRNDLPHLYDTDREMTFTCGDFLTIPLHHVTVALINSTCFPPSLVDELGVVINNTPSIRSVFSLRPLAALRRLAFRKTIPVECSWDSTLCYYYS